MKYCSECGKKVNKESKFCGSCGKNLNFLKKENSSTTNLKVASSKIKIASSSRRFINYLIDIMIGVNVSAFIFGAILGGLGLVSGYESESVWTFYGVIAVMLYYFIFESFFGKTIGKAITKTRVVMENGEKPTTKVLLIRTLCRLIPFEIFSFTGNNPVGWHDKLSKTIVVED